MHFKLIIAFMDTAISDKVMEAARDAGATGATLINNARGEGIQKSTTFFGLTLETQRDVILFLVEEHLSRHILETINQTAGLEEKIGTGIAIQIDVEDAIGVSHQVRELAAVVEEKI